MAIALAENAVANGVELYLETPVKAIEQTKTGFDVIAGDDQVFNTRYVVNAAGLYSDKIAAMVGLNDFQINLLSWCHNGRCQ